MRPNVQSRQKKKRPMRETAKFSARDGGGGPLCYVPGPQGSFSSDPSPFVRACKMTRLRVRHSRVSLHRFIALHSRCVPHNDWLGSRGCRPAGARDCQIIQRRVTLIEIDTWGGLCPARRFSIVISRSSSLNEHGRECQGYAKFIRP